MQTNWKNPVINFTDTAQWKNWENFLENIKNIDTTNERLKLWHTLYDAYALHREEKNFDIKEEQNFILIGSEVWNSIQTAAQAVSYLQDLEKWTKSKVILINNASRAKHKNIKDSWWSYPYIVDIIVNWTTHHITWVDDEALVFFAPFIKKWNQIRKVTWIKDTWSWDKNWWEIEDTSKNTQFRSKDHFPLIQHITIKILEENPKISEEELNEKLEKYLVYEKLDIEDTETKWQIKRILVNIKKDIIKQLWEISEEELDFNELVNKYIEKTKNELPKILEEWWVLIDNWEWKKVKYEKEYLEWFEWIETIQLIWEIHNFIEKFWVTDFSECVKENWLWLNKIKVLFASVWLNYKEYTQKLWFDDCFLIEIKKYKETREKLWNNEICIIDRDKFWNWIFTYSDWIKNWIDGFSGENWFNIEDEVEIKDENWKILFSLFLTKNIWDKTWENCIWNSSSRWLNWETLLNINKSFWKSHSPLKEIGDLAIWSILTIVNKKK